MFALFDHLEESCLIKKFSLLTGKNKLPLLKNVNETPGILHQRMMLGNVLVCFQFAILLSVVLSQRKAWKTGCNKVLPNHNLRKCDLICEKGA